MGCAKHPRRLIEARGEVHERYLATYLARYASPCFPALGCRPLTTRVCITALQVHPAADMAGG